MGLFSELTKIGGRLGMVQIVSTTAPAARRKIPTRKVVLKDLAAEIHQEEVRSLAQMPAELSVEFAAVFEAAGIQTPAHGWTTQRLAEALHGASFQKMDRPAAQKEILRLLSAEGAHVHEIVQDAVARDQALDSFEAYARRKMEDRDAIRRRKIAETQAQIQELQRQVDGLQKDGQEDQAQWKQWQTRKSACEKEMAWAVGFLVENKAITVDPGL